ncbi:MAG: hypothetical protein V7629_16550 [Motiliproteus sp.]
MSLQINELCHLIQAGQLQLLESFPGLNLRTLRMENRQYAGTGGISQLNCEYGFVPAFQNTLDRINEISRFGDGRAAPLHLLDGLPDAWVIERSPEGKVLSVKDSVIAGFLRQDRFYTREQAASAVQVMNLDDY